MQVVSVQRIGHYHLKGHGEGKGLLYLQASANDGALPYLSVGLHAAVLAEVLTKVGGIPQPGKQKATNRQQRQLDKVPEAAIKHGQG